MHCVRHSVWSRFLFLFRLAAPWIGRFVLVWPSAADDDDDDDANADVAAVPLLILRVRFLLVSRILGLCEVSDKEESRW